MLWVLIVAGYLAGSVVVGLLVASLLKAGGARKIRR
jgi:glycerol-3-phosphate acyltransferase PlsY